MQLDGYVDYFCIYAIRFIAFEIIPYQNLYSTVRIWRLCLMIQVCEVLMDKSDSSATITHIISVFLCSTSNPFRLSLARSDLILSLSHTLSLL